MSYFGYKAVDPSGNTSKGVIEATNLEEAIRKLRQRQLYPVKIEPAKRDTYRKISEELIISFCKDLSELLKSGLPIDRSLALMVSQQNHPIFKRIVQDILSSVQEGKSLSEAMENHETTFGSMAHHMIRAGEASGTLTSVLDKLSIYLERRKAFRESLISASIYPLLLLTMSILSMTVLVVYVIPKFAKIFEDLKQDIPFVTKVLLKIGGFLENYGWLIPFILLVVFFLSKKIFLSDEGRKYLDRVFLKLPIVKTLVLYTNLSRFFISLGTMVKSGVPLLRAIYLARNVVLNHIIRSELAPLYDRVKTGKSVSSFFAEKAIFPARIATLLRIGEEKGELGESLLSLGNYFEQEIEKILKRLVTLIEPLIIIGTGLVIGIMVLSMFSAIVGISDISF